MPVFSSLEQKVHENRLLLPAVCPTPKVESVTYHSNNIEYMNIAQQPTGALKVQEQRLEKEL